MLNENDIILLKGHEVSSLLAGREIDLINIVKLAYEIHAKGDSSLPHSTFLRFPNDQKNRIIALPAYLGGKFDTSGIKWISSFPDNCSKGLERASAVVILNSMLTGRPKAILEGSVISAKRTAASAALAAKYLSDDKSSTCLGLIGCGLINFEIFKFILSTHQNIRKLVIYDLDSNKCEIFKSKCKNAFTEIEVQVAENINIVFKKALLVSIATTAIMPHIYDLSSCTLGSVILHISLRDISAQAISSCNNIVDDIDHVCRADTSIHWAEKLIGHRKFIRCTLADITTGKSTVKIHKNTVTVFSPFGLGILDIAVGNFAYELAISKKQGSLISSFF